MLLIWIKCSERPLSLDSGHKRKPTLFWLRPYKIVAKGQNSVLMPQSVLPFLKHHLPQFQDSELYSLINY